MPLLLLITSLARISAGGLDRVAAAIQMSRSVIMPRTLRSELITGTAPQSPSHINLATTARSVSGPTVFTLDVCSSLTVMVAPFQSLCVLSRNEHAMRHPCQGAPTQMGPISAAALFGSDWPDLGDQIEVPFEDQFSPSGSPPLLEVANDWRRVHAVATNDCGGCGPFAEQGGQQDPLFGRRLGQHERRRPDGDARDGTTGVIGVLVIEDVKPGFGAEQPCRAES